jgi:hypothetical protein
MNIFDIPLGQDNKKLLEEKKLELEIKELRQNWLKKPQWWAFFTTAFVSGFSFLWFWGSGAFDAKRELLKLEIAQFDTTRNRLIVTISNVTDSINQYRGIVKGLTDDITRYKSDTTTCLVLK